MKIAIMFETILSKIKLKFKPSRSTVFIFLDKNYHKLILANYNNIIDYAEKLRKNKNKLLKLDSLCKIGESHFIYKFVSNLDLKFEIFLATFNQTHSLKLSAAGD